VGEHEADVDLLLSLLMWKNCFCCLLARWPVTRNQNEEGAVRVFLQQAQGAPACCLLPTAYLLA